MVPVLTTTADPRTRLLEALLVAAVLESLVHYTDNTLRYDDYTVDDPSLLGWLVEAVQRLRSHLDRHPAARHCNQLHANRLARGDHTVARLETRPLQPLEHASEDTGP